MARRNLYILKGFDLYGNRITETVPVIERTRIERAWRWIKLNVLRIGRVKTITSINPREK